MKRSYLMILLGILTVVIIVILCCLSPIPQDPGYHHFAGDGIWNGYPNVFNVLTNLPFVGVGIFGLYQIRLIPTHRSLRAAYLFLFGGILLTGLGSAYYHCSPTHASLVWDRIPMTIVFMSFTTVIFMEWINIRWGQWMLAPLVVVGVFSVFWWYRSELQGEGDLRLYIFVQFYPMLFIPIILLLFPLPNKGARVKPLACVVLWYAVAKLLEQLDHSIYEIIGIGGHSLKHLAAAVACWYLVRYCQVNQRNIFPKEDQAL